MKKLLLALTLFSVSLAQAQVYSYGFPSTGNFTTDGWVRLNLSSPTYTGAPLWEISNFTPPTANSIFGSTSPQGQAGGLNSFALVNYTSTGTSTTTGSGTISNWLISPSITIENGDIVSFWSRKGTDGATDYPDRLELRLSAPGTITNPSGSATSVGSFTTLALTINPNLQGNFVYPKEWTQYSYTVSGLTGPTAAKVAFRYFVTNGGPDGANSDIIGIDTFTVTRPMSTNDVLSSNFSIFPNPAKNVLNISNNINAVVNTIEISDMNGRVVKTSNLSSAEAQISINELSTGMYMVKISSDQGTATKKIIKE
jgi:hypothetical protein